MAADRRVRRALGLVAMPVAIGATWFAAGRVHAPADVAVTPGPTGPVTAPVIRGALEEQLSFTGRVAIPTVVSAPVVGPPDGTSIVTAQPAAEGAVVSEGQVVVEVSGRPVILLSGALPAWRDLVYGDEGADVQQLQAALARLGFMVEGDVDGTFDIGTVAAVRRLYEGLKYRAVPTSADGGDPEAAVDAARTALQEAEAARAAATAGPSKAARAAAETAVAAAARARERAVADDADSATRSERR